jgi:hypothetical protein
METTDRPQETPMMAKPQREHHWLGHLVGDWTYESECAPESGQPAEKMRWTESVRSLGGLWIVAEAHGQMPGGEAATTIMTLGYDPQKSRYVGTFVASMMTHLWEYEGTLDETGRVLTLDTVGPNMSPAAEGSMAQYQDIIEIKSEDHRLLTSQMLGDDGQWHVFMQAEFRRKR